MYYLIFKGTHGYMACVFDTYSDAERYVKSLDIQNYQIMTSDEYESLIVGL